MLYKDELDYKIIRNTYSSSGIPEMECLDNEVHFIETTTSPCKHYCFREDDHSVQLNDIDMKILSIFKMRNKIHFITEDAIYIYNINTDSYTKLVDVSIELPDLDDYTPGYSIKSLVVGDEVYITCPLIIDNVWYSNIYKMNPYKDNSWELFKLVNCYAYSDDISRPHICTWLIYIWENFYYLNSKNGQIYDIKQKRVFNIPGSKFITFHDKILLFREYNDSIYYLINSDFSYTTIKTNFSVQYLNPVVVNGDNIYADITRYYGSNRSKLLVNMYQKECNALVSYFDMKKYIHIKSGTTDLTYDENVAVSGHLELDTSNSKLYMNPKLYINTFKNVTAVSNNISNNFISNIKYMTVYNNTLFIICRSKYYYQRLDGSSEITRVPLTSFDIQIDESSDAFTTCGNTIYYCGRHKLYSLNMITMKTDSIELPVNMNNKYAAMTTVDNDNIHIYIETGRSGYDNKYIDFYVYNFNISEKSFNRFYSDDSNSTDLNKTSIVNVDDNRSYTLPKVKNMYNSRVIGVRYKPTNYKSNQAKEFMSPYIEEGANLKYCKYLNILLVLDMNKGIIYGLSDLCKNPYIVSSLKEFNVYDDIDLFFTDENNREMYILKGSALYRSDINIIW